MTNTAPGTTRRPNPLTPLIGREREVLELLDLLASTRLLTLTGTGGSGKTRLALEVLARRNASGEGGSGGDAACWVELAAVTDPALLPQQVVRALGVQEELRGSGPSAVLPFIAEIPLLLVLDNCEHLVDACAHMAQELLATRPKLTILATSREALGVTGERAWLVPGLAVPDPDASPEAMARAGAMRLFEARARDVTRGFALTPENVGTVADICRRLEGIPLAVELAAARVRVLSVEQIRDRLDDVFSLLTSGGRGVVPRHRTLRAAIDWSHDLLPEPARVLLMRLSVFRGGFGLDGATAVGGEEGADSLAVLEQVARLVDRSLLQVKEVDGAARYTLLETIRQYGERRLETSGEADRIRERHAAFFASEAARAAPHMTRADRQEHVDRLLADIQNLRSALSWSKSGAPALHLEMVADLWWFWFFTRFWKEADAWIQGALSLPEAGPPGRARARLLLAAGALATLQARVEEGRGFLEEAAHLAEGAGDEYTAAMTENYLALSFAQRLDPRVRDHAARALSWFEQNPHESGHRLSLLMSALAAEIEGDRVRADRLSAEAVNVARRFGPADLGATLQNWSLLWSLRGDYEKADRLVMASLAEFKKEHSYMFLARGFAFKGEVAGIRGDPVEGARLLGVAHGIRESIGASPFGADAARLARVVPRLRNEAGDPAFDAAFTEGASLRWESVLDELLEGWEDEGLRAALAGAADQSDGAATVESDETGAQPADPVPLTSPPRAPDARAPGARTPAPTPPPTPAPAPAPADAGPTPGLRIRTLGTFELEGETVETGTWGYARPRELLLFLLLNPRGVTRREIGEAIWPDSTSSQVKNSYHVTLHHLRKRLGDPSWIVLDGERYRLARERGIEWDAERFEEGMRALLRTSGPPETGRLSALLTSYRGPLLDGAGGARWLEDARDRFHRIHVDGLVLLARSLEAAGDLEAGIEAWGHVVQVEELNEEGHRGLMRGWAQTGARDRALRHFDRLRIILKDALDAEPEDETRRLQQELAAGRHG
jgi:predicted ATPase/DNA-binding SARP family transcriptional activator